MCACHTNHGVGCIKERIKLPVSSLRRWRYCKRTRNKVLAAEPTSERRSREENGRGTLKYRLHENHGFLNSPHTSVRENRIGRGK